MLPIDRIRADIVRAAQQPGFCLLLSAPTGSGKSTRVPLFLDEAGAGTRGTIIVVQPRRLAARLLAGYVARQFPCPLGREVGYTVRFDSRTSSETRILYMTDGLLERRLTDDPELRGVAAVIFDEVHERRLSGDLCLARALQLQTGARPDLGIVVMSATPDLDKLCAYLPQATVLRAEGRLYPVEVSYRPPVPVRDRYGYVNPPPVWEQCAAAVHELIGQDDGGDILVFLPGAYEIRRTVELLEQASWMRGRDVYALHGQLTPEQQAHAVERGERPRVIVATNIAETSLTIEGVRSVVDSGTARKARWDPRRCISTLHIVPISRAQAEQRAGRAGRLGPGRCIRLWSEAEQLKRPAFPSPEIHRADLSAAYLNLQAWGYESHTDVMNFPWLDAPTELESQRARRLLIDLGAIRAQGGLTPVGRAMLSYPLSPVLSRLMVAGRESSCEAEMAAIAALIQSESVAMGSGLSDSLHHEGDFSDFQAEWRAVEAAQRAQYAPTSCAPLGIMGRAAREVVTSYRQLMRGNPPRPDFDAHRDAVVTGLLHSFPDRVAARNSTATYTARLTGQRSGKIVSAVGREHALFLAAEVAEIGGKGVETRLSRCTALPDNLPGLTEDDIAVYDSARKRVLNHHRRLYRDLVIDERETGDATPEQAAPILAEEVVRGHLRLEQWDGHVIQWLHRLNCLRRAMPELELPMFGEEDKQVAVTLVCEGAVCYRDIENRPVLPVLEEWLSPWQREALNRYAPKVIKLANGREVKLLYQEDGAPHFALKCQLLFGVPETPTIADGRVKCLVEILAPNQRPYQITGDLPSFWRTGYPQMKKDLAGRYPRHNWPDTAPDAR